MNTILIHPSYFPSISHYVTMLQADHVIFENDDNFQKQTNRNRMYIYSPNGIQMLNIPIKHQNERQKYRDIKIENDFGWQKNHFKSLEAAYRTSPFFEYFEDDFRPIFENKKEYLLDLNYEILEIINSCLGIDFKLEKTNEYFKYVEPNISDYRSLINGKTDKNSFEPYTQVFNEKHGFINNLSILDLLFNEGRYAVEYLKQQQLIIK